MYQMHAILILIIVFLTLITILRIQMPKLFQSLFPLSPRNITVLIKLLSKFRSRDLKLANFSISFLMRSLLFHDEKSSGGVRAQNLFAIGYKFEFWVFGESFWVVFFSNDGNPKYNPALFF